MGKEVITEYNLYNGKAKIFFNSGTPDKPKHTFKDEKGKYIPSVTKATGIIDKSGALMGWTAKMMGLFLIDNWDIKKIQKESEKIDLIERAKKEYRRVQVEAQDIGTEIHDWISAKIKGEKPDMPEDERVVNGITAFLKFQKDHKFKWLESERVIYSKKHNFAGRLDAIARDGKKILVDFKSTNEKIDKVTGEVIEVPIYVESAFQAAGYQLAYEEETKEKISYRIVIAFGKKTGAFNFRIFDENEKDKKIFLACLQISNRLEELK